MPPAGRPRRAEVRTVLPAGDGAERASSVRLAPDGAHVAFAVPAEGGGALRIGDASGSRQFLAWDDRRFADVQWSPQGTHLAYAMARNDAGAPPVVAWAQVRPARQLGICSGAAVRWAPSGRVVVVADPVTRGLYAVEVGGARRRIAPAEDAGDPLRPPRIAVSADSTLAAVACLRPDRSGVDVWTTDVDGIGRTARIAARIDGGDVLALPAWAPRGRALALLIVRPARGTCEVAVVAEPGAELRVLRTGRPGPCAAGPAWSPSGDRIAWLGAARAGSAQPRLFAVDAAVDAAATRRPTVASWALPRGVAGDLRFVSETSLVADGAAAAHVIVPAPPVSAAGTGRRRGPRRPRRRT